MTTLLVMYVCAGLLLSALGVPLMQRKVGPNPIYGFRVKQTLDDPRVWYEVNAVAGRGMLVDGLVVAVSAVVLASVPGISIDRYALSITALFLLTLGITLVASIRHLKRCVNEAVTEDA